jgi:hypothetical protein
MQPPKQRNTSHPKHYVIPHTLNIQIDIIDQHICFGREDRAVPDKKRPPMADFAIEGLYYSF